MTDLNNEKSGQITSYTIEGCDTLTKLFQYRVKQLGLKTAMSEKKFGIWEAISWEEYGRKAREIGMGLVAMGLEKGDICAILSEDNKEWLFSDFGIQCCGGITNGIYTTDSANQLEYLMNDSRSKFLFVENEEQLDKYLQVKDRISSLVKVIVYDPEGLYDFKDDNVMMIEDLYELGRKYNETNPNTWDARISASKPEDTSMLIYTSGTTGPPKGAMISHRSLMFQILTFCSLLPFDQNDEMLCFLPLCHVGERLFSVLIPLKTCGRISFAESMETVNENVRELSPTIFFAVPRIWEKFYSSISLQVKDATRVGKWLYKVSMNIGYKAGEFIKADQKLPVGLSVSYWLVKKLILANILRILGLDRVKFAVTGAAPISPDLIKWYYALGIHMVEGWGQTESCGFATINRIGRTKQGTVGEQLPGIQINLTDEGEILIKGPDVFQGYFNQPEKTQETVVDGWLHTGDVGVMDKDGYLKITDRIKDIIITSGGKNISPSEIENQLKFSPYITDAVVIGDKRKYLSCLIMIDQENVEKFAQDNDIPYTNFASLCKREEVVDLIWNEVVNVNKKFARVEQIKKIRLIDQLLTAEDDELTPTMKLKRKFVNEKYKELIDSMY